MAPPAERRGGRRLGESSGTREAAMTAPRVSLPFLLLALILSILGGARRADAGWTAIGPEGGTVTALAINPATPTTLYAGTFSGAGVFKSTNGGASWTAINSGLPGPQVAAHVLALAIDPATPTTLYAGTNNGVFKS